MTDGANPNQLQLPAQRNKPLKAPQPLQLGCRRQLGMHSICHNDALSITENFKDDLLRLILIDFCVPVAADVSAFTIIMVPSLYTLLPQ